MYISEGAHVFYCWPNETGERKLFLTVHLDNGSILTVEDQATVLAALLTAHGALERMAGRTFMAMPEKLEH